MPLPRYAVALLVVSCLLLLQGCWVYSVYPLAESDADLLFDKALPGNWMQEEAGCLITISRLAEERGYRLTYIAPNERKGEGCLLDAGKAATFQAGLVEIGQNRFLDLFPVDRTLDHHALQVHSFYRVSVDVRSLSLTPMNADWLKEQIRSNAVPVAARQENDDLILSSSTRDLRTFLQAYGSNEQLFDPVRRLVFQRKLLP
jgi:hypothetical protein